MLKVISIYDKITTPSPHDAPHLKVLSESHLVRPTPLHEVITFGVSEGHVSLLKMVLYCWRVVIK